MTEGSAALAPSFDAPPQEFTLQAPVPPPINTQFQFSGGISVEGNAAVSLARAPKVIESDGCAPPLPDEGEDASELAPSLASLKPLGQIRESFILAVNREGLWIVDQHVAHERVLFEKVLRQRAAQKVESQRLLMPLVTELTPAQLPPRCSWEPGGAGRPTCALRWLSSISRSTIDAVGLPLLAITWTIK